MSICHIIYHSADVDGKCSGAIAYRWSKEHRADHAVQFHGLDYGLPFDEESVIHSGDTVLMVDFALYVPGDGFARMHRISQIVGPLNFIWIDHHKSSVEAAREGTFCMLAPGVVCWHARGVAVEGDKAACLLAYEYLLAVKGPEAAPIPEWLRFLSDWDTWMWVKSADQAYRENVKSLQFGIKSEAHAPHDYLWDSLLDFGSSIARAVIAQGNVVREYLARQEAESIPGLAFRCQLSGLNAVALNRGCGSETFGFVRKDWMDSAQLLISFVRTRWFWKFTLFRGPAGQDVDCSAIAKQYGGGGHPGAAGFQCQELPFVIKEEEGA